MTTQVLLRFDMLFQLHKETERATNTSEQFVPSASICSQWERSHDCDRVHGLFQNKQILMKNNFGENISLSKIPMCCCQDTLHPKVVLLKVTFSLRHPTFTFFWCADHGVSCWLPSCRWLYLDNSVFFRALIFLLSALLIQITRQSFIATESLRELYEQMR